MAPANDTNDERRQARRKVFRTQAVLVVGNGAPITVRTWDISVSGLCVLSDQSVPIGARGDVAFDMFFEAKHHQISAPVRIVNCIFSSEHRGFRIGLEFAIQEAQRSAVVTHYMAQ